MHNVQAVIDSLSLDVLHEDLTYLTSEAIVARKPDLTSVEYLLEILKSVDEWIRSQAVETTTVSGPKSDMDMAKSDSKLLPQPTTRTDDNYEHLNERIEETIRMTRKALVSMEPILTTTTAAATIEQKDVFKNYMSQKKKEYRQKKLEEKSSSGNSSLKGSHEDLIRLI